jgi:uncharacterized surface protein with fasciclin (FAS1) repeats
VTSHLRARSLLLRAAAPAVLVVLSACDSGGPSGSATAASSSPAVAASSAAVAPSSGTTAERFGAGCTRLPPTGTGSLPALAGERFSTAAAHEPTLRSLLAAVVAAHLADSLDSQTGITLLAPANGAFAALPRPALSGLLGDTAKLTRVLTHHVIEGRLTPDQLAGTHTTLANDTVTITGSGQQFGISAAQTMLRSRPASVVCGNVRTANATVYIIDQVLAPQA